MLDRQFREVFPKTEELDIHLSEAESLRKHGNPFHAIRLLKGVLLCYKLRYGKMFPEGYQNSAQILGKYLNLYSHRTKELSRLTDPYGCIHQNELYIESTDFAYKFKLDPELRYQFPEGEDDFSGEDSDYLWQVHRFYKEFPLEEIEKGWDAEYRRQSEGIPIFRPDRIVFTVGTSLHYRPTMFDAKNYYKLWDSLRGINERTMREWEYRRRREGDLYKTTLLVTTPQGRKVKTVVLEKYFLRGNRGILFAIGYPEKYEVEARKIWDRFTASVIVE
ncbi:hypothetical protein CH373_08240 [Leptospira perolatii]|uniref:Uncharacterized protein n=1 Tax=Leptospira perolatii TaxID=2023191 RepID=A0A2M9ZNN2_9LEPT|nr:hypothetical protein CH360_13475 [Leptospira perolatii]PJZ73682.1 hypothetical protein CH373_08240 [Leptospira perolatii]